MFSPLELILLGLVGAGLGFFMLRLMRPSMQRAVASAPPQAIRTPKQRKLHWGSMLFLLPPLLYIFGIDGTHFGPVLAVFILQAAILAIMRSLGIGYARRIVLLPVVSIASVAIGACAFAWPTLRPEVLNSAPWVLLGLSAICLAVSNALSIYSFPIGFGEGAR